MPFLALKILAIVVCLHFYPLYSSMIREKLHLMILNAKTFTEKFRVEYSKANLLRKSVAFREIVLLMAIALANYLAIRMNS